MDDSGGAVGHAHGGNVGRAKMLATLAPAEEPPAKRAEVAEGSEARPASKAKTPIPLIGVHVPAPLPAPPRALLPAVADAMQRINGRSVAARESASVQQQILTAFVTTGGDEKQRVKAAYDVLRSSGLTGSQSKDINPTLRLLRAAGLISPI